MITCGHGDFVRLRGLMMDRVDLAFRGFRALHCVYTAVHDGAQFRGHVATCKFLPWGELS